MACGHHRLQERVIVVSLCAYREQALPSLIPPTTKVNRLETLMTPDLESRPCS